MKLNNLLWLSLILVCSGCQNKGSNKLSDTEILHQNQDKLTRVIIYDVFTPPVASRIYAYSSLASYEAMRFEKPGSASIAAKLNGYVIMPEPEKGKDYNFTLAATQAFFTVVHKVVFSIDSLKSHEAKVYGQFKNTLSEDTYNRSVAFGDSIGKKILAMAAKDGYFKSRSKAKFLGNQKPGQWRPTPPDYMDGVEWCWGTMKPLILDSATLAQDLPPPPQYNLDVKSEYYREVQNLYKLTNNLTQEQKDIARYWDDNPFVMEHSGHMSFANKKITPGGHWMGIAAIASRNSKSDAIITAKAYAVTAVAMYDAFICCWSLKYKHNTIRPITVINESIDNKWQPMLQTPPFPEYPSGHSTITRAAATVLTKMFGDNFRFEDTSDFEYIGMKRKFKSFVQAADEASISRVYGGIHYRFSVDEGVKEGKKVGEKVVEKLDL
ncbi:MAG: vanadium-dependent haloperoxidase [Flavobacterium sp.]|nr:vanadium-dependent haloperoxidase [Pedobacter sp.]